MCDTMDIDKEIRKKKDGLALAIFGKPYDDLAGPEKSFTDIQYLGSALNTGFCKSNFALRAMLSGAPAMESTAGA